MEEEIDLWKRQKPFTWKDRFSNWGIDFCDARYPYYGGHTLWLSDLLNVDYLWIGFHWHKIGITHMYYDGYHHGLHLGIITINWGGRPYKEDNDEKN
jgi:hypothetical protein